MSNIKVVTMIIDKFMVGLAKYFNPGIEITVIVRNPKDDESFLLLSNDDLHDLSRAVKLYADRFPTKNVNDTGKAH
jgi:hypothetical protein